MTTKLALVLGATGGIGGAVADRLVQAGWTVRALYRPSSKGERDPRFDWIEGDAISAADVAAAARGASLIVHAVNPPGYRNWATLVLPMLDNTIAAARANGARIILPGTVYNYGPDALPNLSEDAPQTPRTRKGKIRVEMERRLAAAAATGEAKVLIVRAGDFFGPTAGNNWLSQGIVTPGKRPTALTYPGKRGVGHQWAYVPDVAETMVRLIEGGDLEDFATFHMDGHWDPDGTRMIAAIQRALGGKPVPVKAMPWLVVKLLSPFVPLMAEMTEMEYLWHVPVRLENDRLIAKLGKEPRTPLDEAMRTTLAGVGCL
tara:strand:+ start:173 stop:1123 length:951 start_codon:yes stop_codon:yes gene_type:complete